MVQNNKVLTVSYGTFSCTLEGFDDSFETMKAIAEYFRDLAADDRYFGSEPPQPDAEMLTRIAQRDVARKVEASQNDTGLLLRATETDAPAVPTPDAVASTPEPAPVQTTDVVPPAPAPVAAHSAPAADSPAADSIAAKLQRIRAVVSHSEEVSPGYSEDEDSSYLQPVKPKVDAISAAFEAGALDPADLQETEADTFPAPEPALTAEPEHVEELAEAQADEAAHVTEPESSDELVEETSDEAVEETSDDLSALVATAESANEAEEIEASEPATADVTEKDVLFSDLDDEAPEVEEENPSNILGDEASSVASEALTGIEHGIISVEEEALLLDEIALVESELEAIAEADVPSISGPDEDVSRLMDEADVQLDDPATSDQRETYSHLRAAVAATEAEREAVGDKTKTPEDDFRGDLASVVNPRRPAVEVTSQRPTPESAAPLKLVAEQRIDTENADTGPVTPRRITSTDEDTGEEEGGFATFAQEQGAQSLPDLLEAAAAYLSFIEGQEQFSRPQLMNKVRSLKQDAFNREESLRSFGQLLRDGKIEKAGGGRFAASTEIGFRPNDDERAAG